MAFTKLFAVVLAFIVSVSALSTSHALRSVHHHAIARRVPQVVNSPAVAPLKKKRSSKRRSCKPKASASGTASQGIKGGISEPSSTSKKESQTKETKPPAPTKTPTQPPAEHTTTHKASPTPPPPAPTPTHASTGGGNQPSYMTGTQSGDGTFYATGLGACGITNNDSQHIAAVSHLLYDSFPGYQGGNPNNNPICGRKVIAHHGGNSVEVTITDRCAACKETDLDFSPSAFNTLADPALGRIAITWEWA